MLRSLLFFLSLTSPTTSSPETMINEDIIVLLAFKAGVQDPLRKLSSWNEDDDSPCNWTGVSCNPENNRVTELTLNGFSLSGRIGRNIAGLRHLQKLSLANNSFEGFINPNIAAMKSLRIIDFSNNKLSESIPGELFLQCVSLQKVTFSMNNISGRIPESLSSCRSLIEIDFSSNHLSGSLPSGLSSMKNLRYVDFSDNLLQGDVADSMQNLIFCSNLDLKQNSLEGELPRWISRMRSLRALDLSNNGFSGQIPSEIIDLRFLKVLKLSRNRFSGNIEFLDSSSSSLEFLDLSCNELSGRIPYSVGSLTRLQTLNLSRNVLAGPIPSSIGKLTSARFLDLSNNFLNGEIPSQISKCSSLISLILARNNLTGRVPAAMAEIGDIRIVDISSNSLSGILPKDLSNLSRLIVFDVSSNNFEGELPFGRFFNTIPLQFVSDNPSLCGSAVKRSCPSVHPKPIVLNPNSSGLPVSPSVKYRNQKRIMLSVSALIAIGAAACIAIGVVAVTLLNIHVRASMERSAAGEDVLSAGDELSRSPSVDANYGKLVMFSSDMEFIVGAHALLNKDCELGRGGFGIVYRTMLQDKRFVAIKKLTVPSLIKCQEDFERKAKELGKIRHDHLISLEGYYWTQSLQLLIYEYADGGSLYKRLHEDEEGISWRKRFEIVLETAKGLAHLHRVGLIHYNVKSSNIMIDASGTAKIGDYSLVKLLAMADHHVLSSKIQSALGYMAPEIACRTVKITKKCDVYAFGILVLEVVTGKKPVEYMEDDVVVLYDMVRGFLEEGRVEECVDWRFSGDYRAEEAVPLIKLGLICASQVPSSRPDMAEVVNILELIRWCPSDRVEELE